ncbi:crossover junction endodeoxyribonuclease RuvC [Patescibacteria group bacterium]|nr:crossover junction endodeoxyribonuclease RuvC [Patescibacteria group bacterium]MBU2259095.1 crossover junction endodeoxyribonuclease RuvC [Patescibacteria group bacterium]
MIILGIDPGLATTGIAIIETDGKTVQKADWFTIATPAHTPLSDRLSEIQEDLSAFLEGTKPDLAVVERLFFAQNEKTALDVAHARGVILLTLQSRAIPIIEPTPLELKSCITGDGKADKIQIQQMLMRELHLDEPPKPDDAADALAMALFGVFQHLKV